MVLSAIVSQQSITLYTTYFDSGNISIYNNNLYSLLDLFTSVFTMSVSMRVYDIMKNGKEAEFNQKSFTDLLPELFYMFKGKYFVPLLNAVLLTGLGTFLLIFLFIFPAFIFACGVSQTHFVIKDMVDENEQNNSAITAMQQSWDLMKGWKWEFFILGFSFILWMMLGGLFWNIPQYFVLPYIQVTYIMFYQHLTKDNHVYEQAYNEPTPDMDITDNFNDGYEQPDCESNMEESDTDSYGYYEEKHEIDDYFEKVSGLSSKSEEDSEWKDF